MNPDLIQLLVNLEARVDALLFGDERPRNPQGEYEANQTGGADPTSMAAAYGSAKGAALVGAGAVAGAAAALSPLGQKARAAFAPQVKTRFMQAMEKIGKAKIEKA